MVDETPFTIISVNAIFYRKIQNGIDLGLLLLLVFIMTSSNRGDTMRLKSSVLRNSEASENDIPVDGIYGSNGFYFQVHNTTYILIGFCQ